MTDQTRAGQPPQAAFSVRRMRVGDHETAVGSVGESGPAVVLVHAMATDHQMWEPIASRIAKGRRVFAYDVRGHGAAHGAPRPHTMDGVTEDFFAVLDALGLESAHVVGISYGGAIAQAAAIARPDRFESLALLATTDFPAVEVYQARARSAETEGMQAQIEPTLTRWFSARAIAADAPGVRFARDRITRMTVEDWAAGWRCLSELDVQGKLADFAKPTLVVAGELDAASTPALMREMAGRVPGSVYRELSGLAHLIALEEPERAAGLLDQFLPTR